METSPQKASQGPNQNFGVTLIWAAILFSLVIYGFILFMITKPDGSAPNTAPDMIRTSVTFVAVVAAIFSTFFRRIFLSDERLKKQLQTLVQPGDSPEKSIAIALPKMTQTWLSTHIVSWAMNEVIAINGFLLALLHKDPTAYLPFFGTAVVMNIIMRPRLPQFTEKVRGWIESGQFRS